MTETTASAVLEELASESHLSRDRAVNNVRALPGEAQVTMAAELTKRVSGDHPWFVISSAVQASTHILSSSKCSSAQRETFALTLLSAIPALVANREPRVRTATASLCGCVADVIGARCWTELRKSLTDGIERNFELDDSQRLREAERIANEDLAAADTGHKNRGLEMVHETEGWRSLETSLLTVSKVVSGCGRELLSGNADVAGYEADKGLIRGYIVRASKHPNRFVREAGLRLFVSVVDACDEAENTTLMIETAVELKDVLSAGLQDNWSQVRYVASVVARKLMSGLPLNDRRSFYGTLLPRMCLNRHYVAEGVRAYSQATWRDVIGADGRVFLTELMPVVIAFYETQCNADNHAVREAACQSLAEAATRLEPAAVRPHVPKVVNALIDCFKDESWPVRDHACTALADVTAKFPDESEQTGRLTELYELFYAHLADNISSVRQNTANSVVKAASAFPVDHETLGMARLSTAAAELIPKIENQMKRSFSACRHPRDATRRDRNTGYGAAAKLARDNDVELHSNQVMYSCGSLAPKLRRGGGCMDHGFSRAKEPWEETDGGVKLWASMMTSGPDGVEMGTKLLPLVMDAAGIAILREFVHAEYAQEAVWKAVSVAAPHIPADAWAEVLNRAAPLVDASSRHEHHGASTAARGAMRAIQRAVGLSAFSAALPRNRDRT